MSTDRAAQPHAPDGEDTAAQPYRDVVEIRVHGVSGTLPADLLDRVAVRPVAGDRIAGFFRPVLREEMRDHAINSSDTGPWLEAYSWGGLTSGGRTRAFWLALFPFALVNVAPRMLPPTRAALSAWAEPSPDQPAPTPADRGSGVNRWHWLATFCLRWLALSLTMTFSLSASQIGLIAVGRYCAALPDDGHPDHFHCYGLPGSFTQWLSRLPGTAQLAVGLLVPVLFLALLWFLSGRTVGRYEGARVQTGDRDEPPAQQLEEAPAPVRPPEDDAVPLLRADLWDGVHRVRRLRRLHVQAGFAVPALLMCLFLPDSWARSATFWCGAALLTYTFLALIPRPAQPKVGHHSREAVLSWIGLLAVAAASAAMLLRNDTVGCTPAALGDGVVGQISRCVVAVDDCAGVLFVAQLGLVLVVLLVCAGLSVARTAGREKNRHLAPMRMGGMGAGIFAMLGLLAGWMIASALMILAPTWLFTPGFSLQPAAIVGFVQGHFAWFGATTLSTGYGAVAALVIIVGIVLGVLTARFVAGLRLKKQSTDPGWLRAQKIYWRAALIDHVTPLMVGLAGSLAVFLVLQGLGYVWPDRFPALADLVIHAGSMQVSAAAGWGAFVVVAALVGMILLGVASYRRLATRKGVGVLWDLACFWPRDVHPFAPPCYAERAVPELVGRIRNYRAHGTSVILAAHSQGTVISMAAMLSTYPPDEPTKPNMAEPGPLPVGLLTFGCVLDRLYARFFPRYFSLRAYELLAARLADEAPAGATVWANLWRRSDYLGGPVPFDRPESSQRGHWPHDCELQDPSPPGIPEWGVVFPPARQHSNYWRDPAFQVAVAELTRRFRPGQDSHLVPRTGGHGFPSEPDTLG